MDFDRIETREERFDPDNQVARSQQSTTEQNRGAEPQPTTVASNLPGNDQSGSGTASQENRQEETTNYEIGRTTRSTLREHPVVRRVSVAVLVDGVADAGEAGGAPSRGGDTAPVVLRKQDWMSRSMAGAGTSSALAGRSAGLSTPAVQLRTTVILLVVSVPVLSEQMVVAPPMPSQAERWRTSAWSVAIIIFME